MIRKYRESDYQTLCDIARRAWARIFQGFRQQLGGDVYDILNPDAENSKDRQIRGFVDQSPDKLLVAERNGRTVGFITYYADPGGRVGVIGNNAVDPLCGEKGVGQEMYQAVFAEMREKGLELVKVTTGLDEAHAPARRAYERAGFSLNTRSVTYVRRL